MKVLEVINSLQVVGGAETFSIEFVTRAYEQGHDVFVAILYSKGNQDFMVKRIVDAVGNDRVYFLDKTGPYDFKCASRLKKLIQSKKPDAIHTENNCLITAALALWQIKKSKRPITFHTVHLPPVNEAGNKSKLHVYRHIFKNRTVIPVGITNEIGDMIEKDYKFDNPPIIQNGIDPDRFQSKTEISKRGFDICTIGRMTEQKNYFFSLKVFEEVHKKMPAIKVAICGDGPLAGEIKQYVESHKMTYVELLGIVRNPEEILANSKTFFLGSIYEANPMSLWEAMACGCVPVVSDLPGMSEIISSKEGYRFKVNDVDEACEQVVELLTNQNKLKQLSLFCREKSLHNSSSAVIAKYMNLLANGKIG